MMIATEKITITLPTELMTTVRTLAPARRQSQFIAEAIHAYIAEQERNTLRERLIAGYQANAGVDAALSAEWEAIENESWLNSVPAQADGS
jgi:metal-responsive CopG/Arc/MetJ family transcriptional regulator